MSGINRMTLVGAAVVALVVFGPVGASAFHAGGVAHCDGCHTIHNSADNPANNPDGNDHLLKGSDASSTCLNCHNGAGRYHIKSTDGSNVNQGGDFYWMTLDYTVIVRGNPVVFSKDDHGHNVIASDFGMLQDADPDNEFSPGGTYPSASLGCNSCHDPHGQVQGGTALGQPPVSGSGSYGAAAPLDGTILGNYRLLGDSKYTPPGGSTFGADAPIAATANGSKSYGEQTDYGSGMSEWCANCHTGFINDSFKHPAGDGEHLGGLSANYNKYVKTGDISGDILTAFDPLVPFERGETNSALLNPATTAGADASSNVMCLTCHRAHASANANAGKWDFEVELLAESHALESADVPVGAAVYYGRGLVIDPVATYGPFQRSLCNKCHIQD